jgi:diguanylate cyclase (GGDEF)-like protein
MRTHSLILWLGGVWIVLGGLLALGLHVRLSGVARSTAEFTDRQLPMALAVESIRSKVLDAQATCHHLLAENDPESLATCHKALEGQLWTIESELTALDQSLTENSQLRSAFRPAFDSAVAWHRAARQFAGQPNGLADLSRAFTKSQSQLNEFMERDLRPVLMARADATRTLTSSIRNESLALIGLAAIAGCALTVFMARTVRAQHRTAATAQARQTFEARVSEAMNMAQTEGDAMRAVEAVIQAVQPSLAAAVLLADSSKAHLRQAAATSAAQARSEPCSPLCEVRGPAQCPAVRRGFEVTFSNSTEFDACPHLRDRSGGALAAACVPITIAGQHVGVLHAVTDASRPLSLEEIDRLTVIAAKAGERVGVIRAFNQSEDKATRDPLTGLFNRRTLEDRVQQWQRSGTPFCIVYADIDHFKNLNDTHGHETGDRVLRVFSRIMTESLRPTDLLGRWGGEEFVLLLPRTSMENSRPIIERLRCAVADAAQSGAIPSMTVSFGLAECEPGDEFSERLAEADGALLRAKQAGRNRIMFAGQPAAKSA